MGVVVIGNKGSATRTQSTMASEQSCPKKRMPYDTDTITCKWSIPITRIELLRSESEFVNLFLKYNDCEQKGKYTIVNFHIPRQIYVPQWERVINLFMVNSPEGWDMLLELEIESC